ncbi:TIGR04255 family protein [Deinococcus hopiensis]|uniref:TIGR04255 family protein n=1 Tax=Deinococcus hopiensis KR-140 TaxID=695939 RepID=A0A1W1VIQ8_9DEIO|nr:TIGR04255 family protein [Deinococcus hopiensis]SMB93206.1 TIGR04255 family protein [Deinococcus hopiensis KR-140]
MTNQIPLPEHPKLKDPTVKTVAFEMTFVSKQSAEQVVSEIQRALSAEYPKMAQRWGHKVEASFDPEDPSTPQFTASIATPPPNEPQFKFYSDQHQREVQVGEAFLQFLLAGEYPGWSAFLVYLKKILSLHHQAAETIGYTSFKLIYVNRIDWFPGAEEKILEAWTLPVPPPLSDSVQVDSRQQRIVIQFPDGDQEITITAPGVDDEEPSRPVIQLDIDHHIDFDKPERALPDNLLAWLEIAHERIHQTFRCALRPDFLEAIS